MKHLSKCLALVLAAALLLGLAACGKDTTGDDWRASGVVTDYGTITRDGERVPVCICLSTENAAFYYDEDEQVWFDGVEFPTALTDALTAYSSTSFDDLDGDGQSDVTMIFDHGDGSTTELVWLWYDDTGFEFEARALERYERHAVFRGEQSGHQRARGRWHIRAGQRRVQLSRHRRRLCRGRCLLGSDQDPRRDARRYARDRV